ncbi:MAG: helix-turn-helix transcriptional regulator [Clostridia bacterium]|nr:helix-turn-helix transcriptional regulator [Clostridia bacterium]
MSNYGKIIIKINEILAKRGLSKNKLCHLAEMERTQLNNYCNNKITRLDTDVLARLCNALNCEIGDILEYAPLEENDKKGL